jgi:hypothetical protein
MEGVGCGVGSTGGIGRLGGAFRVCGGGRDALRVWAEWKGAQMAWGGGGDRVY